MRPPKIALLVSLLAPLPAGLFLPLPFGAIASSAAQAQTPDARQTDADRLFQQGEQQLQTSQYPAAIESWQQALEQYRAAANRNGEAKTLVNLGNAYDSLSEYAKAIEYYQQALPIFQQVGNPSGEASALGSLGNIHRAVSQYPRALEYYQQALSIFQQVGNPSGEAVALANLGLTYSALSQYPRALEYYQQALPIFRQIGDRRGEARALVNLGNAYGFLSQYEREIEDHQQALGIFREVGDRQGTALALMNLGNAYEALSQYQKAIEYHQQALPIFQQIGDRGGEGAALTNLGNVFQSIAQYPRAIEAHQQALGIFQQIGDRNSAASALLNLGNAYQFLAQYPRVVEAHQQALGIFQQIGDRNGEALALMNLGNAYRSLSQPQKAIESHQKAIAIFRQVGDRSGEGLALNNLGVTLFESGKTDAAEKALVAAIEIWESLRAGLSDENKISIFEEQARSYRTLQRVLIAQNKPEAALAIAERGRARAFVELLAQKFGDKTSLPNQAATSAPSIQQIQQIAQDQNATLVQYSIIYDNLASENPEQVRESALYIWVIQPDGQVSFRPVDLSSLWQQHSASLADVVVGHQAFLAGRNRQGLTAASASAAPSRASWPTLHQLLIDPIADLLPQDPDAHVIFIPQGSLFQVPFPALQDAKGDYLIQKHTILTAPSIQVLALTRQQRERLASQPKSRRGEALILGNPAMPSMAPSPGEPKEPLSPLPGAEAEAKAIAALLKVNAITGGQGTETAIVEKMPQARLIHLATHGLLDNVQGLESAIALTPSSSDDGFLTAAEILDLQLQAELVVLSACDTARGKITGDGVIGLSRSLISAGVPSVLVSLWAVPDAPTADLMTAFYQNLQTNPNKAQALRQAMLSTMETYPDPGDWAAFTLIGEAE